MERCSGNIMRKTEPARRTNCSSCGVYCEREKKSAEMLPENSCELFLLPHRLARRPWIIDECLPGVLYTANVPLRRLKSDLSLYASPYFRVSSIMDGCKQEVKGLLMHQRPTGSTAEWFIKAAPCPAPPPPTLSLALVRHVPDVTVWLADDHSQWRV